MLSVITSTALILFQRGARIRSLGQRAVGCLRCGHRRARQQNQHSCEIRVQRHYKETTSHFQHKITNCHGTHYEWYTQRGNKTKRFGIILNLKVKLYAHDQMVSFKHLRQTNMSACIVAMFVSPHRAETSKTYLENEMNNFDGKCSPHILVVLL